MYKYELVISEFMFEELKRNMLMVIEDSESEPEYDYYGTFFINKLRFDIQYHNHTFYLLLAELDDSGRSVLYDGQRFSLRTEIIDQIAYRIRDIEPYGLEISSTGLEKISKMNTVDDLKFWMLKHVMELLSWVDCDNKRELYESEDFWGDHPC